MKIIRNYYTLAEIFPVWTKTAIQTLTTNNTNTKPTYADEFEPVINLIYDSYKDYNIGFIDKCDFTDPTGTEIEEEVRDRFIRQFAVIYKVSCNRYLKLLALYEAEEDNLMNKLTNTVNETGTNRTNDTPQNGGTFEDDEHTSLYMSSSRNATSTVDPQTVMSRLDEIQSKYMNIYKDWVKEFRDLFFIGD